MPMKFTISMYRIPAFSHNPYVGSFHSIPSNMALSENKIDRFGLPNLKRNPLIGTFRHSPSVLTKSLGLKGITQSSSTKMSPLLSQIQLENEIKIEKPDPINFVSSLKKIPSSTYSSKHSCDNSNCSVNDLQLSYCSICIESFLEGDSLSTLACGHQFHSICISKWFYHGCLDNSELKSSFQCPECRQYHLELYQKSLHFEEHKFSEETFVEIGQSLLTEEGYDLLIDNFSDASSSTNTSQNFYFVHNNSENRYQ